MPVTLRDLRARRPIGDQGASLVIVVATLPLLILLASLAVDTANWFVHKRHLQTQADSGALAAARDFQFPCGTPITGSPDAQIIATAHKYDGTASGAFNQQVQTFDNNLDASASPTPVTSSGALSSSSHDIISLVNSPTFASIPGDTQNAPDVNDTELSDPNKQGPCKSQLIDLKLTETNTPWFFKVFGVKYINAQARVGIFRQGASNGGQLPLGIPLPTPKVAAATFIDEGNSGAALSGGGVTLTGNADKTVWTGTTTVTVPSSVTGPVGMKVALGGNTSTTCGTAGVQCFDLGFKNNSTTLNDQPWSPTKGIRFLRTWTQAATPGVGSGAPEARDAGLSSVDCDPYFTNSSSSCHVTMSVRIEADSALACADLTLTLKVNGTTTPPGWTCPSNNKASGVWTTSPITVAANSGPTSFALDWEQTSGKVGNGTCTTSNSNNSPCKGQFGTVERSFTGAPDLNSAGASRSGPISYATVTCSATGSPSRCTPGAGAGLTAADSLEKCSTCTYTLSVEIHVYSLATTQTIDPRVPDPTVVKLHLDGNQGNQAISCTTSGGGSGPNSGQTAFSAGVLTGCTSPPGPFLINGGTSCPASPPSYCVNTLPGGKVFEPELNARFQCGGVLNCGLGGNPNNFVYPCNSPNYWTAPHAISDILAASPPDPRLVQVFITPSGSYDVNGTSGVPIRGFASFYVTGYDGDPCPTKPSGGGVNVPKGAYVGDDPASTGEIVGHFVTQNDTPGGNPDPNPIPCDPAVLGDCVTALVK